ncbi:MAG: ATP-dependent sacrificial sulfur transferase LarE [Spirochaetes bacterium]|nr:ATP-dependent sacrificial sulfur transferase LarE [Spirochaetota bacterium]
MIGDSASLARSDLAEARGLAERFGLNLREVKPLELENPAYRANPVDRCYHCKSELFGLMEKLCQDEGWRTILDGYNRDDDGDYRPGRKAAGERAVKSPLSEAGFGKKEVRLLARAWGLPNWDKPAAPCLSSRFPYGTAIDAEKLSRVERAEAFLRGLGLREFRVRFHEAMARIEARPEDFPRLLEARAELTVAFRGFGFKDTVLDLTGFRSGSINEGLPGPLGGPAKS